MSEGKCLTGYRECGTGSDKKCIGPNEPCGQECPSGRSLCGTECTPDHYISEGWMKECGGECIYGGTVCKDGGDECHETRTKCGNRCILNSYYSQFGYSECAGKCISGSEKCCENGSVISIGTTAGQNGEDCCGIGYFSCGKECRLIVGWEFIF